MSIRRIRTGPIPARKERPVKEDPVVEIYVEGGIASVMTKPRGVVVKITDFDDEAEEPMVAKTYGASVSIRDGEEH